MNQSPDETIISKLCLPIQPESIEGLVELIESQMENYHYFEVWVDELQDDALDFINQYALKLKERLIIVFRRKSWEKPKLSVQIQEEILHILATNGCIADFDIEKQSADLVRFSKIKNLKLITSFHNYELTPLNEVLEKKIQEMASFSPFIFKIACTCNSHEDAHSLLSLCFKLQAKNKKHIILGMGSFGKITRIAATLWGNEFIFAPLNSNSETAPQQLTRAEIVDSMKILL